MKRRLFAMLVLGALLAAPAWADRYKFAPYGVGFEVPTGFAAVPFDKLPGLVPHLSSSIQVITNPARTITFSYELYPNDLSRTSLPHARETFEKIFEKRVPGLKWKQRETITVDKETTLHFEFESKDAKGTSYYNIMYMTPIDTQMVVLNFAAPLADMATAEPILRAAAASLKVHDAIPTVDPKIFKAAGKPKK